MNTTVPARPAAPSAPRITAVVALVAVVVGIVAVAFRGSWGALRDAALAAHFDRTGADLYPFAVDGLLIVAILAAVLLRHNAGARRYCLWVIGAYTAASWLINFLHGLGLFTPRPGSKEVPGPSWYIVLVIASLVVGSIFLGSHLLIFVWRHVFPDAPADTPTLGTYHVGTEADQLGASVPEPPIDVMDAARRAYRHSRQPGLEELSQAKLMNRFGISKRQAAQVQSEVKAELAEPTDADTLTETVGEPSQSGQGAP